MYGPNNRCISFQFLELCSYNDTDRRFILFVPIEQHVFEMFFLLSFFYNKTYICSQNYGRKYEYHQLCYFFCTKPNPFFQNMKVKWKEKKILQAKFCRFQVTGRVKTAGGKKVNTQELWSFNRYFLFSVTSVLIFLRH